MKREDKLGKIENRIKKLLVRDKEYDEKRCDDGSAYLITKAVAYFEPEDTRVNTWSAERIRSFAKLVNADSHLQLSLTAYASSASRTDSHQLARKRALEVAAAFVKNGVSPSRISIDTLVAPIRAGTDSLGEQYNRRVEATLWNTQENSGTDERSHA